MWRKRIRRTLRQRVVEAVERDDLSCNQTAARFEVAISTAIDWVNRYRRTGSLVPGKIGRHRAPRGQRLLAKVPHGRWTTMTFLAALRHDRVNAPWLIEGSINGESFRLYIDTVLIPTLCPGDIVVVDNLGSHFSSAVLSALKAAGAKFFFLPKCSLDMNPMEILFSKLKHGLPKPQSVPTTPSPTCYRTVQPAECQNCFAKARYA